MAKEKILVVDDEEDILELLRFNLLREGYNVSCAASGEEALRLAQSEIPDLLVQGPHASRNRRSGSHKDSQE